MFWTILTEGSWNCARKLKQANKIRMYMWHDASGKSHHGHIGFTVFATISYFLY